MKLLILVFAALALAKADTDWSRVKPLHIKHPLEEIIATIPNFGSRIVGGEAVAPNSLPYQVGLLIEVAQGTAFCGGSLISKRYVLTAAHCVENAKSVQVVLAAHKIKENEKTQVRLTSKEFKHHPQWNKKQLINDIAVVKLPSDAPLNNQIKLVSLPSRSDAGKTFEGQQSLASGWGKDSDKAESISPVLRSVKTNVMTNKECNTKYLGVIQSSHLCSSGKGGKGACSGDSGGPLLVGNKQVGLVSFGLAIGCEKGWPSVYTRLTSHLDWIQKNTDVVIKN